jgi:Leucine-rich repeat (LRR) protein
MQCFQELPDGFFNGMTSLKSVNLNSNRLRQLQQALCLDQCPVLNEFRAESNGLMEFHGNFESSPIASLWLGMNVFVDIPACIYKMHNLVDLVLNNNKIQGVGQEIQELGRLSLLNLQTNDIKQLPAELAAIKTLKKLNVQGNLIRSIPMAKVRAQMLVFLKESF